MKHIITLALFAIIFACCSKEKSIDGNAIPVVPADTIPDGPSPIPGDPIAQFAMTPAKFRMSSKLIKREESYMRTNPDLKSVRIFSYDNSNRCVEIQLGSINSSLSNPVFNLKQTITFHYEGTNTLLPSALSSVRTVFPNLVTKFYYTYNNEGLKIKDSVRVKNQNGDPADIVIHYVYTADEVYATPVINGFPMENHTFDTLSLLTGGNIEKLVSKMIQSAGDQTTTYRFTYDQHISPYSKLNISNSLYFESSSLGLGYNVPLETHYMGVTTNNMTSWTSDTYSVSFKYEYDNERYPVRKEMILPGETQPFQVTLFEY